MSTNKTLQGELQHGDEAAAALPSPPEAHPVGAPTDSLRQADEPPSEATQSPKPRQPDGPAGTAGDLTVLLHSAKSSQRGGAAWVEYMNIIEKVYLLGLRVGALRLNCYSIRLSGALR